MERRLSRGTPRLERGRCSLLLQLIHDRLALHVQDVKKFEITIPLHGGLRAHESAVRVAFEPSEEMLDHGSTQFLTVPIQVKLGVDVEQNLSFAPGLRDELGGKGTLVARLPEVEDRLQLLHEVGVAVLVRQQEACAPEQTARVRGCPRAPR